MDGEVIGLIAVVLAQGGLIWYKLGRCEQKIEHVCEMVKKRPADKQEDGE